MNSPAIPNLNESMYYVHVTLITRIPFQGTSAEYMYLANIHDQEKVSLEYYFHVTLITRIPFQGTSAEYLANIHDQEKVSLE